MAKVYVNKKLIVIAFSDQIYFFEYVFLILIFVDLFIVQIYCSIVYCLRMPFSLAKIYCKKKTFNNYTVLVAVFTIFSMTKICFAALLKEFQFVYDNGVV